MIKSDLDAFIIAAQLRYGWTDKEALLIKNAVSRKNIASEECLLEIGKYSTKIYFLFRGMVKGGRLNPDGEIYISWITNEILLVGDLSSFYHSLPLKENLIGVENSLLYSIELEDLKRILPEFDDHKKLFHSILIEDSKLKKLREQCLAMKIALDAMRYFKSLHPYIIEKAPQIIMAEYFGISPETYNRYLKLI